MLLRTQSHLGNNTLSVVGAGIGVATRRDFGASSIASGLTPRRKHELGELPGAVRDDVRPLWDT